VAKAATEFMKTLMKQDFIGKEDTTHFTDDQLKEQFTRNAQDAIEAASTLAHELQEWWELAGDQKTIFFDVQDSPTSNIERELSEIVAGLGKITDELDKGL
jgi:NAD+--asparagine ADP-ribosyltransferase